MNIPTRNWRLYLCSHVTSHPAWIGPLDVKPEFEELHRRKAVAHRSMNGQAKFFLALTVADEVNNLPLEDTVPDSVQVPFYENCRLHWEWCELFQVLPPHVWPYSHSNDLHTLLAIKTCSVSTERKIISRIVFQPARYNQEYRKWSALMHAELTVWSGQTAQRLVQCWWLRFRQWIWEPCSEMTKKVMITK